MRISDWSSDVCSSDLPFVGGSKVRTPDAIDTALAEELAAKVQAQLLAVPGKTANLQRAGWKTPAPRLALPALGPDDKDRETVVVGNRMSGTVDIAGGGNITKKK